MFQAKHLDTPRLIADDTQRTVWKWEQQEPFGVNAANDDPDADNVALEFNLRFPGQYFDKETNAHYNYFRDYDPAIGRYIESDPIGLAGGMNTYLYAVNPLLQIDPRGLQGFFQFGGQAGIHLFIAGVSVSQSVAFTLPSGEICSVFTYCIRLGPGIFLGAGGVVGGGIVGGSGGNLGGFSFGGGADIGAGAAAGVQATVGVPNSGPPSSFALVKGKGGFGWGASIGLDGCWSEVSCTRPFFCKP